MQATDIEIEKLVENLKKYIGLKIDRDVKVRDLITVLKTMDNSVINLNNVDEYLPEWKTMSSIKFDFTWQPRCDSMDTFVLIKYKDGSIINNGEEIFDNLIYESPFRERMNTIADSYTSDYGRSLFSSDLLEAFKENDVQLIMPHDFDIGSDS